MCGIVAILGQEPVAPSLISALRRLEYRGYDSAGLATLERGRLARRRAQGKLQNLEIRLKRRPLLGTSGIGHTRWATHGAPSEINAHPHATDKVALVHNGIIENFRELRDDLRKAGVRFSSETDSEVVAQLVSAEIEKGQKPLAAVAAVLPKLSGTFAFAFLFDGDSDLLVAACRGSPLVIGHGRGEMYLGSDAAALAPFTNRISYLEDGEYASITRGGVSIFNSKGEPVDKKIVASKASVLAIDKGKYCHFMAKEIHEQPHVVDRTLGRYRDKSTGRVTLGTELPFHFRALTRVMISACGTSYYAGLIGRSWLERYARLPVDIDVASELRYREIPLTPGNLAVFVSQSGETADTLATLRHAKQCGQHVLSISNVATSALARESHFTMPTLAGPEISVASTKAFTCQLAVLACLAIAAGRARGVLTRDEERKLLGELASVPGHISSVLLLKAQIRVVAKHLASSRDVLYLGRGINYPVALEGALKLKEISYIHAEGFAAGELKHGPIALVDTDRPVIVIAPHDDVFDKTSSNMQEVAARGGRIILITDARGVSRTTTPTLCKLVLPDMPSIATPFAYATALQLIAYYCAKIVGTDLDQPRNLAKSVTVE